MSQRTYSAARAVALSIALLLCLPAAYAVTTTSTNYLTGTVVSTNRDLNYFTIRDSQSDRDVKIDVRSMDTRQSLNVWNLRSGDRVAVNGGWSNNKTFRALNVNFANGRGMATSAINDPNVLVGTVESRNRNLNYITVRDQNGRRVKVDVRRMDTRQSVNVWQLRAGDTIAVSGAWSNRNRNTFVANRVSNSNGDQSMTSGYGNTARMISGTVQSTNRDLNYVTVRDDATGTLVKIDVRRMDERHSVNVWRLRAGDRISANGSWFNRDTFQADTINF